MQTVQPPSDNRVYYFDNLRYFLVLLVVLLHSTMPHTTFSDWWTVNDANAHFFDVLLLFLDHFLMPALFFIAGFFALLSHEGKTTWEFIAGKIKRLGIPWLIGIVFLNPIQAYIQNYSRYISSDSFVQLFVYKMQNAFSFYTGLIYSRQQFSNLHFWFISLLLLFFILFALIKNITNRVSKPSSKEDSVKLATTFSIFRVVFISIMVIVVLNLILFTNLPKNIRPEAWFMIGSFIQFQVGRIVILVVCFCLGVYACRKNWFYKNKTPGNILIWLVTSLVLSFALNEVTFSLIREYSEIKGLLYTILFPVFFFSILLFLISFGAKYWENGSKLNRVFADSSYNIYLVHMAFIYLSQLVMLRWFDISIYIKAVIVCVFSICMSLFVSHYVINKSPRLFVAGLGCIFILMLIVLK